MDYLIFILIALVLLLYWLKTEFEKSDQKVLDDLNNLRDVIVNRKSSSTSNSANFGFLKKKLIDENIKLVHQTGFAATFYLEDAKLNADARLTAEIYDTFKRIESMLILFTIRDFTKEELDYLLKMNMYFREVYDKAGLKEIYGKFDDLMNPSFNNENDTWDNLISNYQKEMKWI